MTRVADSSFLIALFETNDRYHAEALELAEDPRPIMVPPAVLGETLGVVDARIGYREARNILSDLEDLHHTEILDRSLPDLTGRIWRGSDGTLSWVDAAVVARCREDEAEPLAFDPAIEAAVAG